MSRLYERAHIVFDYLQANLNASLPEGLEPIAKFSFGYRTPDKYPALLQYMDVTNRDETTPHSSTFTSTIVWHLIVKNKDAEDRVLQYADAIIGFWQAHQQFGAHGEILMSDLQSVDFAGAEVPGGPLAEAMIRLMITTYEL